MLQIIVMQKVSESWAIVLYVGESNVKMPSYKEETCSNGSKSKSNVYIVIGISYVKY